jgi:hypothetical protein
MAAAVLDRSLRLAGKAKPCLQPIDPARFGIDSRRSKTESFESLRLTENQRETVPDL